MTSQENVSEYLKLQKMNYTQILFFKNIITLLKEVVINKFYKITKTNFEFILNIVMCFICICNFIQFY